MSRATLESKIDRTLAAIEREQERHADQEALTLINASLTRSLSLVGEINSDEDFYRLLEQMARFNLEEGRAYTPRQRKALESFSRRYNCAGAKDELLRQLEQRSDQDQEGSAA